jgi:hypothetical protein
MRNPCLDAAIEVLEQCGIRDREIARGSKHPQIRFRINGEAALHVFALSGTASDHRSPGSKPDAITRLFGAWSAGAPVSDPRPIRTVPKGYILNSSVFRR